MTTETKTLVKASELRIGNWVVYKDDERIKPERRCKFIQIDADDILALTEGYDVIESIPLTPEILKKCGFKQNVLNNEHCLSLQITNGIEWYGFFYFVESNKYKAAGLFHNSALIGTNIYYLHQLQNLYFALTGKELPINL